MNSQKPKRLRSKNIIVTGSASGIGRATAAKVISEGAKVALFDSNKAGLNSAVLSMKTDLDQVKGWAIDIAEENSVKTAISHAVKWFGGRIDVLIHLAGIFRGSYLPVEKVTTEDWEIMSEHIQFDFIYDNHFAELKDKELMEGRLGLLGMVEPYVGRYYSTEYVRRNVLRQKDSEIVEIDEQIEDEIAKGVIPDPINRC